MKYRPIHENLDTSFVNLSALIKFLRRRQFVGAIRIEFESYEADIILSLEDQIKVREHDLAAGRVAEGDEALERLLIRAREPSGVINVYQASSKADVDEIAETDEKPAAALKAENSAVENRLQNKVEIKPYEKSSVEDRSKNKIGATKFPFELSNNTENRVRKTDISAEEWQTLLNLTGELLRIIDGGLAEANLIFASAFEKARTEISVDYPFLNPIFGAFSYRNGRVSMNEQINAAQFVAGINETLRLILSKLGQNPKFADVYRTIIQKILALVHNRKPLYDKFSITPQLEKIIGV